MSIQTRAIRCARIGMGILAFGAGGAQGQWHYYYFKEKRPLKLDVDRVALLRPAQASLRVLQALHALVSAVAVR